MINKIDPNHIYDLPYFQNRVLEWADYIDLIKEGCIYKQIEKIKEEVDEYEEAIKNGDLNHAGEELVDVFVTCIISAEQNGIKISSYLDGVIAKLVSRKDTGKMVNGSFIKKEDLKCQ